MAAGPLLHQQMAQWSAQMLDVAVVIQIQLQANAWHHRTVQRLRRAGLSIEQAGEQIVTRIQNCRLDEALSVSGRRGTEPIPGSTRNGSA